MHAAPEERARPSDARRRRAARCAALRPRRLGRALLGRLGRRLELGDDRIGAGDDPAGIVIGAGSAA